MSRNASGHCHLTPEADTYRDGLVNRSWRTSSFEDQMALSRIVGMLQVTDLRLVQSSTGWRIIDGSSHTIAGPFDDPDVAAATLLELTSWLTCEQTSD